jgi:glycosyltransferase involved in cell wall biosynthesis
MRVMKILASFLGCDGGKSGVGQYAMHLMREFSHTAPDARFDALLAPGEEPLFASDAERTRPIYVPERVRGAMANLVWQQWAIPRLAAKNGYDLVFIPAGNRRMPYWTPCPRVGTFHDLAIAHLVGKYDRIHTIFNRRVLPALTRKLTLVISVSEFTKRDLIEHVGVPEERIIVIPHAADTQVYYPRDKVESSRRVAERFGVKPPYLIYVSRIEHPGKNHLRLIRAFARLKEKERLPHQLVLAGSDWHGAETVHAEAAAAPCAKDIVFTGFAPQDCIPDLYCGAEALVFPSLFEGFGMPILEAMACGLPVACANVASLPEAAGGAALLFDPLDEDSIESALRSILLDEPVRADCVARGDRRIAEYSWTDVARKTFDVFIRATREAEK